MFVRALYILDIAFLRSMILCLRETKISKSQGLDPQRPRHRIIKRGTVHLGVRRTRPAIASMYNSLCKDKGILLKRRIRRRQPLLVTLLQMPVDRNCIFSNCSQSSSLPISNTTQSWVLRKTSRSLIPLLPFFV